MLMDGGGPREVEAFSRLFSRKVMASVLPPEVEEDLILHAKLLARQGAGGLLSLRSSAVGEDSSSSFAGLYRSILDIGPDDTPEAYRKVVAGLYAPEAIIYRQRQGLLDVDAEMQCWSSRCWMRPSAAWSTPPIPWRRKGAASGQCCQRPGLRSGERLP